MSVVIAMLMIATGLPAASGVARPFEARDCSALDAAIDQLAEPPAWNTALRLREPGAGSCGMDLSPPDLPKGWSDFEWNSWLGDGEEGASVVLADPSADEGGRRGLPPSTLSRRQGGSVAIDDRLNFEGGLSELDVNRRSSLGYAVARPVTDEQVGRSASLYDASLKWTAVRTRAASMSLLGGMRASSLESAQSPVESVSQAAARQSTTHFQALSVAGAELNIHLTDSAFLRGTGIGHTGSTSGGQHLEWRLETVVALSPSAEFSIGYQYLKQEINFDALQANTRRDAVLLELRIGF